MHRMLLMLLLFGGVCGTCVRAQQNFFVNGDAVQLNDSCFRLTTTEPWQVGSIWWPTKIDLRNSFDLVMSMNLGCRDADGADGIVFGLQPISASVGEGGEGLGIGGVRPALGVEFDTYQNGAGNSAVDRRDPSYDHIAIMANGAVTHAGPDNLAGPVRARVNSDNIESCRPYPLRVTWDAEALTLSVYFDCELRIQYTGDIVNEIFGGDPFVYYGFAGATGGLSNVQEVCFTFNSFRKQLQDVVICPGAKAIFDVTGGARYEWTPARGLSSDTTATVEASPDSTTTYTVKIFDDCGLPLSDAATVSVQGDSAFVDLGPDTVLCPGEVLEVDAAVPTAVYSWSDSTLAGARARLDRPGTYTVTATRTDIICTASDRVELNYYGVPEFDIGPADTSLCTNDTLTVIDRYPFGLLRDGAGRRIDTVYITRGGRYRYVLEHPCVVQEDVISVGVTNCRQFYMPTAFTPNDDGQNDWLYPQDAGDIVRVHRFAVYDRWGGLVFETDAQLHNQRRLGWNGEVEGRGVYSGDGRGPVSPSGAYMWVMEADFRNGQRRVERGMVMLLR